MLYPDSGAVKLKWLFNHLTTV